MIDTARNRERGEGAVKQLEEEGLHPEFLPLDVDSEESIRTAKETVEKKYGRLDVLINNAGILLHVMLHDNNIIIVCHRMTRSDFFSALEQA